MIECFKWFFEWEVKHKKKKKNYDKKQKQRKFTCVIWSPLQIWPLILQQHKYSNAHIRTCSTRTTTTILNGQNNKKMRGKKLSLTTTTATTTAYAMKIILMPCL